MAKMLLFHQESVHWIPFLLEGHGWTANDLVEEVLDLETEYLDFHPDSAVDLFFVLDLGLSPLKLEDWAERSYVVMIS